MNLLIAAWADRRWRLLWTVVLCWCGAFSINAQDSLQRQPIAAIAPLPKRVVKQPVLLPLTDIAKVNSLSYFPIDYQAQRNKIARTFYTDNIFDIDESDNPFALPLGKQKNKKRRAQEPKRQNSTEVVKQLFSAPDDQEENSGQWLIFILLGLLGFLAVQLAVYAKDLRATFQAFLSTNASKHVQREQAGFLRPESWSSYLLFAASLGTFVFLSGRILQPGGPFDSFGMLLLVIFGVLCTYLLKHIQLLVLSFILPCPEEIQAYNFIILTTNKALGVLLLPLLFLIAYLPSTTQLTALYVSFGLVGLVYVFRTLKGFIAGANLILFRKFHFFVYLCTVEIAPTLILLKLLYVL